MEGKEQYKPEAIRESRIKRGKEQFLVKWKGFSEEHNSWEFESPILSNLIKKFKKGNLEKNNKTKIKPTPSKEINETKEEPKPISLVKVEQKTDQNLQYTFQQGKRRYQITSSQANNIERLLIIAHFEANCKFPKK